MLHICETYVSIIIIMALAVFEKIKYHSCNAQNIRSGEMANFLLETYKNTIIKIQMLSPQYVFVCINTFYVVMFTGDALLMKIKSVNGVRPLKIQL